MSETLKVGQPATAPSWALRERRLLAVMGEAAEAFVARYTRSDGTLVWRDEWPGMDGSDDGYESFGNFPLYYALGGSERVHELSRRQWDAVTWQFTEYGQVHREFDGYYDWMHHGESNLYLYFFGLADPTYAKDVQRAIRFAGMYLGEDEEADNWDAATRRIRSPITGSRGPRFENSEVDWVTHRPVLANYPPPFEDIPGAPGPKCDWNDDAIFREVLRRLNERQMRCDVPLNLTTTSLITHAFAYTGEEKYRTWVTDYTAAWMERTAANGGIIPDNIGPSGRIGEFMEGKWWGGYYGWRWPHGLMNQLESTLIAAANCLLLTGDASWLELPRSQMDMIASQGEMRDGRLWVPHRHGDSGWYDLRPLDPRFHVVLYYLSCDPADWERVCQIAPVASSTQARDARGKGDQANTAPWLHFVSGRGAADYPDQVLAANEREMLRRLEVMAHDDGDPADWDVHHWQEINPIGTEALVQCTLGGPQVVYHGGLLHCRLRYYDPAAQRPGLPPETAALVTAIDPASTTVELVNLDPLAARRVTLQAGAFAEHEFTTVAVEGNEPRPVDGRWLEVELAPGSTATLRLGYRRYANAPSYVRPWDPDGRLPAT